MQRHSDLRYIGTYKSEFDAAVAIVFAKKLNYLPSPKAKDGQGKEELSPFHGIDDKEASRLASPRASYPASPIPQPKNLCHSTLRGRAHKSLLQSYYEAHGKHFDPTPKASMIHIPYKLPSRRSRQDN